MEALWNYFISFPPETARGALDLVLGINVVGAVIIFFKKGVVRINLYWWALPLAVYGFAWGLSLLAGWVGSFTDWGTLAGIIWVLFSLAALTSFLGTLITNVTVLLRVK